MTEPAFRNREDMSEHLKAAGFDDQQIRSILRVMASMVKELGLAIRADLEKLEQRMLELHEEAKKYSRELHEESKKYSLYLHEESEKRNQQAFVWIRWGFGIIVLLQLSILAIVTRGGL